MLEKLLKLVWRHIQNSSCVGFLLTNTRRNINKYGKNDISMKILDNTMRAIV